MKYKNNHILRDSELDFVQAEEPKIFMPLPEITDRIDFLKAQINKIESVTGPSLRTRSFQKEISCLEENACKCSA